MGLFRRRRRGRVVHSTSTPTSTAEPDKALPFFERSVADRFRALVGEVFSRAGLEVVVHPGQAVDAEGREFGLWNVAALCADLNERDWPATIEGHVDRVLSSWDAPSGFIGLERDEAHFRAYSRLMDPAGVPRLDEHPHQEFAPGIVEVIALDKPDSIELFDAERVREFGGFAALRASGITNLGQLQVEQVQHIDTGEARFDVLGGDSVFTASLALLMPGLAERLTGRRATEHGWLLCVPDRHQVAWHVIEDAGVLAAVNTMAGFATQAYATMPGPLSPHLYWWDGSSYQQLTSIADDGRISITVGGRFQAMLEAVTRDDRGG